MSKQVQISAVANKGKPEAVAVSTTYEFGDNLDGNVGLFGSDVVNSGFEADAVVYLQGVMRSEAKKGRTQEQVTEYMKSIKLGVKRTATAIDPKAALRAALAGMSQEERKAYIADLMKG